MSSIPREIIRPENRRKGAGTMNSFKPLRRIRRPDGPRPPGLEGMARLLARNARRPSLALVRIHSKSIARMNAGMFARTGSGMSPESAERNSAPARRHCPELK